MTQPYRPRRTCLAVPGSSPRFLVKARGLADFMASIGIRSLQVGAEPEGYTGATRAHRGAVMLRDEMIDEASRKLAMVTVARGRAAGLARRAATPGPAGPGGPGSAEHPPAGQRLGQPTGQG